MTPLVILAFVICSFLSVLFWSIKNGIAPMPSWGRQTKAILSLIPSGTDGLIYELGSGWGALAVRLARQFPQATIVGIENSPVPFLFSSLLRYAVRLPNLQFHRKDFFVQPLDDAKGIVCYLFPGAMVRLKPKLEQELRNDAWIISNTFAVPEWLPSNRIVLQDLYRTSIYSYSISSNRPALDKHSRMRLFL